jgi:hypothetical protein
MANKVVLIQYSSRLSCGRWRHKIRQQYCEFAGRSLQRKNLPMKVTYKGGTPLESPIRPIRVGSFTRAGGDREARGGLHAARAEI